MTEQLKALAGAAKGWRTVAVSVVLAIIGVLQTADWAAVVTPERVGPVMLAVGIVVAVLRVLTDTPDGKS